LLKVFLFSYSSLSPFFLGAMAVRPRTRRWVGRHRSLWDLPRDVRPGKQQGSVRREFGSEIAGWRSPRVFRGNRWSPVGSSSNARAPISPLEGWQRRPPCWLLAARRSSDVPDRGHRGPPEAGFHHDASSPRSRRARSNLPAPSGFPRPDPALSTPSSRRRNQGAQSCRRLPHAFSI